MQELFEYQTAEEYFLKRIREAKPEIRRFESDKSIQANRAILSRKTIKKLNFGNGR
jgi:hypothetical protein